MKSHTPGLLAITYVGYGNRHLTIDDALICTTDEESHSPSYRAGVPAEQGEANAIRIRDTWNACHGLDLPEDVEPGVLAELVTEVLLLALAGEGLESNFPARLESMKPHFDKVRAILAKLTPLTTPANVQ